MIRDIDEVAFGEKMAVVEGRERSIMTVRCTAIRYKPQQRNKVGWQWGLLLWGIQWWRSKTSEGIRDPGDSKGTLALQPIIEKCWTCHKKNNTLYFSTQFYLLL